MHTLLQGVVSRGDIPICKIVYLRGSLRSDWKPPLSPLPQRALLVSDQSQYDSVLLQYGAREETKECLGMRERRGAAFRAASPLIGLIPATFPRNRRARLRCQKWAHSSNIE